MSEEKWRTCTDLRRGLSFRSTETFIEERRLGLKSEEVALGEYACSIYFVIC